HVAVDNVLACKVERSYKAFRLGIVYQLVHPALLRDITTAAAQRLAGGWRPKRKRVGGFVGWLLDGNPLGRALVFRMARKQVLKQTKGNYPAPLAALEAVQYGLAHGLAQGLKREAQLFGQLAVTDVSRKLVQIFFATSQLKKDFGVPNPPPPAEVRRLGVVGSGFMGSGIAGTAVVPAGGVRAPHGDDRDRREGAPRVLGEPDPLPIHERGGAPAGGRDGDRRARRPDGAVRLPGWADHAARRGRHGRRGEGRGGDA